MEIKDCINLESCMDWVEETIDDPSNFNNWIGLSEEEASSTAHYSVGTYLRNTLNLWHNGPPVKWFNEQGIYHPDDMSNIIFVSLHRRHNKIDVDLNGQIKDYIEYWEETDPKVNKGIE